MTEDLIRLMQTLFLPAAGSCREPCWRPLADIYQTRTGWLVKLDLAGIRPDEVRVSARGRQLVIRGRRRDWAFEEGQSHYHMEIAYSEFERGIELPCDLERADITTDYRDGMLLIRIQPEEEAPRDGRDP